MTATVAQTTELVVLDMQQYFCEPEQTLAKFIAAAPDEAAWYYERVEKSVIPRIARLPAQFEANGALVVFTEFGCRSADGSDLPLSARRHNEQCRAQQGRPCYLPLSDPASRVIGPLQPRPEVLVIQKSTSGPLGHGYRPSAPATAHRNGCGGGVVTSICVPGMARELAAFGRRRAGRLRRMRHAGQVGS